MMGKFLSCCHCAQDHFERYVLMSFNTRVTMDMINLLMELFEKFKATIIEHAMVLNNVPINMSVQMTKKNKGQLDPTFQVEHGQSTQGPTYNE